MHGVPRPGLAAGGPEDGVPVGPGRQARLVVVEADQVAVLVEHDVPVARLVSAAFGRGPHLRVVEAPAAGQTVDVVAEGGHGDAEIAVHVLVVEPARHVQEGVRAVPGIARLVRGLQRVGHQEVDGRLVEDVRVVQIVRVEPAVRGDGAAPFGLVADQLQIAAERVAIHPPVILVEPAVHSGQVVPRDQFRPLVDDMGDRLVVDGDGRRGKVGPIVLVPSLVGLHGVVDMPAVRQRPFDRPVGAVAAGHGAVGQLEHERVRVRADGIGHPA